MPHKQISELVRQMLFHSFCGSHAGKDRIAADMVICLLHGDQLGQIVDGRFAGPIGNLGNVRHKTTHRGNVDDAAAPLSLHMLSGSLACHKNTS